MEGIELKKKNKKKLFLILLCTFGVSSLIGLSYAFFSYSREGLKSSQLIMGEVYMHYNEGVNTITLNNVFPTTQEEALLESDNYITFTIDGKNTTSNRDIYYEILLNHGADVSSKTRFNDRDIRFQLDEIIDGVSETVIDGLNYSTINNTRIFVNTIEKNTSTKIERTYRLRMWVSDDVIITDSLTNDSDSWDENDWETARMYIGDSSIQQFENGDYRYLSDIGYSVYTTDDFKNRYVSIKVTVTGDFVEKEVETPSKSTLALLGLNKSTSGCQVDGDIMETVTDATTNLICETRDNDGESYYFRGAPTNNYVKWAGFYWRIIRVNGDGSIRMIYAGDANVIDALPNKQEVLANGYNDSSTGYMKIGDSAFNPTYSDAKNVGLMYGNENINIYETKGTEEMVETTSALETVNGEYTVKWVYGSSYSIRQTDGYVTLYDALGGAIENNVTSYEANSSSRLEDLVGKYIILYEDSSSLTNAVGENKYIYYGYGGHLYFPLVYVDSVNNENKLNLKRITKRFVEGLDVESVRNSIQTNTVNSTILGESNSEKLSTLNGWYNKKIKGTIYESQVADTVYCNDRSLYKAEYVNKYKSFGTYRGVKWYIGTSNNSGLGIGREVTGFGGFYRIYESKKPSLKCEQQNDRFSVNNSRGNKDLTNPIGLMTVDEAAFAGVSANNTTHYLYTGYNYWTLSPCKIDYYGTSRVNYVTVEGGFSYSNVTNTFGVRPEISINPNTITVNGLGTIADPYVFS